MIDPNNPNTEKKQNNVIVGEVNDKLYALHLQMLEYDKTFCERRMLSGS